MILHTAASAFFSEVIGYVSQENERLGKDVTCLQTLLDFIQKVGLIATINEQPISAIPTNRDQSTIRRRAIIATTKLSDGSIVHQ